MSLEQHMYDAYVAAEQAVLRGQSYAINGRSLTRADLGHIRAGRREWFRKLQHAQARAAGQAHPRYARATFDA